jgi:hypothetical protein
MSAGVAAQDLGVGPTTVAKGDDRRGFVLRDAATNQLQQSGFAHTGILEIRERSARQDGQARGAAVRFFEDDLIGKARQAHGHCFAGPKADLVELRELHHGGLGDAGAEQLRDVVTGVEWFLAAARQTNQGDAIIVGKTGLLRFDDLGHFVLGDVHASESLNGGEIQAGVVESGGVQLGDMVTSEKETASHEKGEQGYPARRSATLAAAEKGEATHIH